MSDSEEIKKLDPEQEPIGEIAGGAKKPKTKAKKSKVKKTKRKKKPNPASLYNQIGGVAGGAPAGDLNPNFDYFPPDYYQFTDQSWIGGGSSASVTNNNTRVLFTVYYYRLDVFYGKVLKDILRIINLDNV